MPNNQIWNAVIINRSAYQRAESGVRTSRCGQAGRMHGSAADGTLTGRDAMTKAAILAVAAAMACGSMAGAADIREAARPAGAGRHGRPGRCSNLKAVARGIKPHDIHRVYADREAAAPLLGAGTGDPRRLIRAARRPRADHPARGENMHGLYLPPARADGDQLRHDAGADRALPRWRESELFSERQRAILAYADGMVSAEGVTTRCRGDEAVFTRARSWS